MTTPPTPTMKRPLPPLRLKYEKNGFMEIKKPDCMKEPKQLLRFSANLQEWLDENIEHKWKLGVDEFHSLWIKFDEDTDAMAFKLRWA